MDIKDAMWLDHALSVCRKFAEKDLGVRVSNTQSIKHVINEFTKMVESESMTFRYWWEVRDTFCGWIRELIPSVITDEEILMEAYNMGDLEEPPHSTPTTDKEKNCCQQWKEKIPWHIRQVLRDYDVDLDTMFKIC